MLHSCIMTFFLWSVEFLPTEIHKILCLETLLYNYTVKTQLTSFPWASGVCLHPLFWGNDLCSALNTDRCCISYSVLSFLSTATGLYLKDYLGLVQWRLNETLDENSRFKIQPIIMKLFFVNQNYTKQTKGFYIRLLCNSLPIAPNLSMFWVWIYSSALGAVIAVLLQFSKWS